VRNRLAIAVLLMLSSVVSGLPVAEAAVTPGSKCSKALVQQTYKGKVYTCIKLGEKLSWNNGEKVLAPSFSSSKSPTNGKDPRKQCRADQEIELVQIERYLFSARQTLGELQSKWQMANLTVGIDPEQGLLMNQIEFKMNSLDLNIKNLKSNRDKIKEKCIPKSEISTSTKPTPASKRQCTTTEISMIRSLASKYTALNLQIDIIQSEINKQQDLIGRYLLTGKMESIARSNFIIEEQSSLRDSANVQASLVKQQFDIANLACINSGIKSFEDSVAQAAADKAKADKVAADKVAADKVAADKAKADNLAKICVTGGICKIGNTGPAGGEVFYDAGSQQSWGRYLEFAPEGWAGSEKDPKISWCNVSDVLLTNAPTSNGWLSFGQKIGDGLGQKIGDGKGNTDLMVAGCSAGAALMSRAYRGGGQNDWFLPSSGELNELCKYAGGQVTGDSKVPCRLFFPAPLRGFGKTSDSNFYWSSSETSFNTALAQFFGSGNWNYAYKSNAYSFRPVRAF
jgi:hypothetical protein